MYTASSRTNVLKITYAGLLIAIGIMIPMFSPLRIFIPPASFTFGSHAAIFIAMFISPGVTIAVTIGTTIGFWLGGFPDIIVLRAASHIIFAVLGSYYLKTIEKNAFGGVHMRIFSFVINLIHGLAELIAVLAFNNIVFEIPLVSYTIWPVVWLVGIGTVIHGFVDMEIAFSIRRALRMANHFRDF